MYINNKVISPHRPLRVLQAMNRGLLDSETKSPKLFPGGRLHPGPMDCSTGDLRKTMDPCNVVHCNVVQKGVLLICASI